MNIVAPVFSSTISPPGGEKGQLQGPALVQATLPSGFQPFIWSYIPPALIAIHCMKTFLAQSRRHGQVRPAAYGEAPGAQARFIQTKEAKYKLVKRKHLWNPLSSPQHSHWWKTGVLLWCVVSLPTKTFELWCRGHRPVFVHTPHIQVKERKIWIGI